MKKKKRIYKIFLSLGIFALILGVITTSIVLVIKKNPSKNQKKLPIKTISKNSKKHVQKNQDSFFPKNLNLEKIYKLIRINVGKPFFKKELVSLIINQVITKGSFINGILNYWYDFKENKKNFLIAFKWESSSGETQEITYNIKIII